jgi:hypothetical protein
MSAKNELSRMQFHENSNHESRLDGNQNSRTPFCLVILPCHLSTGVDKSIEHYTKILWRKSHSTPSLWSTLHPFAILQMSHIPGSGCRHEAQLHDPDGILRSPWLTTLPTHPSEAGRTVYINLASRSSFIWCSVVPNPLAQYIRRSLMAMSWYLGS